MAAYIERRACGALAVVEHPFPVGAWVQPHLHTREDEYSIVTQGVIGFRSGDREVVLEAGGYITKPRGELHTMWDAGDVPARMIEMISPAGFEHFFREVADLMAAQAAGSPTSEDAGAELRSERYALLHHARLIRRYGLESSTTAGCATRWQRGHGRGDAAARHPLCTVFGPREGR